MVRGPKPKPSAIHKLNGYPSRRPLNDEEPPSIEGAPDMPPHMEGTLSVECWDQLCIDLSAMGVMSQADRAIMAIYSDAWALYQTMQTLMGSGTGIKACDQDKVIVRLQKAATELGLSPSARSRVHAKPKEKLEGKAGRLRVV